MLSAQLYDSAREIAALDPDNPKRADCVREMYRLTKFGELPGKGRGSYPTRGVRIDTPYGLYQKFLEYCSLSKRARAILVNSTARR
jgi:hypothetical protein